MLWPVSTATSTACGRLDLDAFIGLAPWESRMASITLTARLGKLSKGL